MMRTVRIDAEKLATHGMRLDFSTGEQRRLLELGPSGAVTGQYELDEKGHRIHAGASHALALTNLEWDAGDVRIVLTSHAKLERPKVDLTITPDGSTSGNVACVELSAASLELRHPLLGDQPLLLRDVRAKRVRLAIDGPAITVELAGLEIGAGEATHGGLSVRLESLTLPSGLGWDGERFEARTVRLGTMTLRAQDLPSMRSRQREQPTPASPEAKPDLRLLDHVSGKVAVDVTVDAAIKSIGRRKATHRFRIPIRAGALDFKTVEKSLARLEDSILDFVVAKSTLRLVKDIPLVPFDTRTLVSWKLNREDQALAADNRVRLRRLLDYQLPPAERRTEPAEPAEPSPLRLDSVRCDDLDVALKLRGPTEARLPQGGRLLLGDNRRAAVGNATLTGTVVYRPGKPDQATTLTATAARLRGAIESLTVAGWCVDAGAVTVDAVEPVRLALRGVVPQGFEATVTGAKLASVRVSRAG